MAETVRAPGCLNCGTVLVGKYCHECGQKTGSSIAAIRDLVSDAFREVANLESRLATTLWTLVAKPGRLTSAYLEGRRAAFMSPIRLYLLTSVAFGAALAFSDDTLVVTLQGADPDRAVWLRYWLWSVLFMTPVFAGLIRVAAGRGRYFAEHLVFAMHFHAFAFVAASVVLPALEIGLGAVVNLTVIVGTPIVIVVYLVKAIRHCYGLPLMRATARSLGVAASYVMIQLIALVGVGALVNQIELLR